mgnify:CR=1 FL=1|jgi:hypothetical protein
MTRCVYDLPDVCTLPRRSAVDNGHQTALVNVIRRCEGIKDMQCASTVNIPHQEVQRDSRFDIMSLDVRALEKISQNATAGK